MKPFSRAVFRADINCGAWGFPITGIEVTMDTGCLRFKRKSSADCSTTSRSGKFILSIFANSVSISITRTVRCNSNRVIAPVPGPNSTSSMDSGAVAKAFSETVRARATEDGVNAPVRPKCLMASPTKRSNLKSWNTIKQMACF